MSLHYFVTSSFWLFSTFWSMKTKLNKRIKQWCKHIFSMFAIEMFYTVNHSLVSLGHFTNNCFIPTQLSCFTHSDSEVSLISRQFRNYCRIQLGNNNLMSRHCEVHELWIESDNIKTKWASVPFNMLPLSKRSQLLTNEWISMDSNWLL